MAPYSALLARDRGSKYTTFSQGPGLPSSSSGTQGHHSGGGSGSSSHGPHHYQPGQGARPPQDFNNKGYFALFAILGAAMVITSIWFFFWAKNGGFVWRRGDWDDYKSTVLRRKGKDGKTLSNATPATDLGAKSIAGTFDVEKASIFDEKPRQQNYKRKQPPHRQSSRPQPTHRNEPSDEDLRAYRHEKPARVGGLNRQSDGSHFDFSSTEPSEVTSHISNNSAEHLRPKRAPEAKKGFMQKQKERVEKRIRPEKKIDKKAQAKRAKEASKAAKQRPRHTFAADEASAVGDAWYMSSNGLGQHDSYFASYRPPAPPHAPSRRHEMPRQTSPPKPYRSNQRPPGSFDTYSDAGSSDTGTKVYAHHIPGLSRGSRDTGFRREAPRRARRDSLSDSENGDLGGWRRR